MTIAEMQPAFPVPEFCFGVEACPGVGVIGGLREREGAVGTTEAVGVLHNSLGVEIDVGLGGEGGK